MTLLQLLTIIGTGYNMVLNGTPLHHMDGYDVMETLQEKVIYYNVQTTAETGTIIYINTI